MSTRSMKTMSVVEAAVILGKPKEYVYGMIQAGVVDFGTYYLKEGKTRGTYLIPVGRLAQYLGYPVSDIEAELQEMRISKRRGHLKAATSL